MRDPGRQLRSWKDIAAYLDASVRTAMRWEATRQLPVHRVGGRERDTVFANTAELDAWLLSARDRSPREAAGGPPEDQQPEVHPPIGADSGEPDAAPRVAARTHPARRRLALGIVVALFGLVGGGAAVLRERPEWFADAGKPQPTAGRAATASRSGTPAAPRARSVVLRLSRPDQAGVEMTLVDGEAGRTGGSPGRPALVLRPRFADGGVVLEVRRADGQPAKPNGSPREPMGILLERGVSVRVLTPYVFDVEWIRTEEPSPPR
jgi:hypothetical protein